MANAVPPAPPVPRGAPPSNGTTADSGDMLELVRQFENMRSMMAKFEHKLNTERLANQQAEHRLEKERQAFVEEMADQRRLLAEERREVERQRKVLEADRQTLEAQRQEAAVAAKPPVPMPKRGVPPQAAEPSAADSQAPVPDMRSRTKAVPVRCKEAPKPPGTASVSMPPPKAKAKPKPAPSQAPPPSSDTSTAVGAADSVSSAEQAPAGTPVARDLEIEEIDSSSDTPPVKAGEADEAERVALEDGKESKPEPSKAPPEPPIYWRHVKPPPKTALENPQEEADADMPAKEEQLQQPQPPPAVKSNPAWAAAKSKDSRYKAPPTMKEEDAPAAAARPANVAAAPAGPGIMKAPPTRCPPKCAPAAPPPVDVEASTATVSKAPMGKVKAAPVPAKAKVKAPPGH